MFPLEASECTVQVSVGFLQLGLVFRRGVTLGIHSSLDELANVSTAIPAVEEVGVTGCAICERNSLASSRRHRRVVEELEEEVC